jgi:hypothetical protein
MKEQQIRNTREKEGRNGRKYNNTTKKKERKYGKYK